MHSMSLRTSSIKAMFIEVFFSAKNHKGVSSCAVWKSENKVCAQNFIKLSEPKTGMLLGTRETHF